MARRENDDDARDYINSAYFLERLSNKALIKIANLKRREIFYKLKTGSYPFSRLSKKNREHLRHLPTNWIYGAARHLLDSRNF